MSAGLAAIRQYYKLKGKYDTQYGQKKLQIIRSDIPVDEKKKKIRKLKRNCVSCSLPVGTTFFREGSRLKAICGSAESPCSLNIDIDRGHYEYGPALTSKLTEILSKQKENIIQTKLNMLFGLQSEQNTKELFMQQKATYQETNKQKQNLAASLASAGEIIIEEVGGKRAISRKEATALSSLQVATLIQNFKELIGDYQADEGGGSGTLQGAISLYIEDILPALQVHRERAYQVSKIIRVSDLRILVQERITLAAQETTIRPVRKLSETVKNKNPSGKK